MAGDSSRIEPPSLLLTVSELFRAPLESLALSPLWLQDFPEGDGHPVLIVPGFATDDSATFLFRWFLARLGYRVHRWDLGWNLDHRTVGLDGEHLSARIAQISEAEGSPLSLLGWSLGGVIAREAARRENERVRQVITLGSPIGGNPSANRARLLYEQLTGRRVDGVDNLPRFGRGPLPIGVPSTSIFSRSDGIVPWENAQLDPGPLAENVEVHSSHFGLVANPIVFRIVADRLAQPQNRWAPYSPIR
jgi:hypothetical protein